MPYLKGAVAGAQLHTTHVAVRIFASQHAAASSSAIDTQLPLGRVEFVWLAKTARARHKALRRCKHMHGVGARGVREHAAVPRGHTH